MSKDELKKAVDEVLVDGADLELDQDAERDWFEKELLQQEEELKKEEE